MKKMLIITIVCGTQWALAENLVTRDGTLYRNVTIISANPDRIMIACDQGGLQIEYKNLDPAALSDGQWKAIEEGLKIHAQRKARLEELQLAAEARRLEQEKFEQAQRENGLVLFEGDWMKPADRQEIMAKRELAALKQERERVELAKQKAELHRQQLLAEQEQQRLEDARKQSRRITYTTYSYHPSRRTSSSCRTPVYYGYVPKSRLAANHYSSARYPGGFSFSLSSGGNSISYRSGSSRYTSSNTRHKSRSSDCR